MQRAKQVYDFVLEWLIPILVGGAVLGGIVFAIVYGIVSELTDCDDDICSVAEAYDCGFHRGAYDAFRGSGPDVRTIVTYGIYPLDGGEVATDVDVKYFEPFMEGWRAGYDAEKRDTYHMSAKHVRIHLDDTCSAANRHRFAEP